MKNKSSTLSVLIQVIFSKEYGFLNAPKTIKGMQISLEKVGMSLKGISYDETHRILDIPVYFFSGDYDQLTPQNILRDYYKVIQAPHKEIFYFHESAHSPLWEESDKFHHIIEKVILRDFSNDK